MNFFWCSSSLNLLHQHQLLSLNKITCCHFNKIKTTWVTFCGDIAINIEGDVDEEVTIENNVLTGSIKIDNSTTVDMHHNLIVSS